MKLKDLLEKPRGYWHEVPSIEREKVIMESTLTVGEFMQKYKQPDWCEYPEALKGQMGCWSLVLSRNINSIKDCGDCDCIKSQPPPPDGECGRH